MVVTICVQKYGVKLARDVMAPSIDSRPPPTGLMPGPSIARSAIHGCDIAAMPCGRVSRRRESESVRICVSVSKDSRDAYGVVAATDVPEMPSLARDYTERGIELGRHKGVGRTGS